MDKLIARCRTLFEYLENNFTTYLRVIYKVIIGKQKNYVKVVLFICIVFVSLLKCLPTKIINIFIFTGLIID